MNLQSLSIIIVSYNTWPDLEVCLQSLENSDFTFKEIIVIDNASKDGTCSNLKSAYPAIRLIENKMNLGHSKAVNQGFRAVQGERILVLDSDTELHPDAIQHLSRFMDENEDAWMVSALTLNSDGSIQHIARDFPSISSGIFGRRSILARLFPNNPFSKRYLMKDRYSTDEPFVVKQISASCMMFRREVLDKVGEFDEKYRGYWVDTDYCKRIEKEGGVIYCVPKAVITHHEQNKGFKKKHPSRIVDFHYGAFRLYKMHYAAGPWDPRLVLAAILLGLRMITLLTINFLRVR